LSRPAALESPSPSPWCVCQNEQLSSIFLFLLTPISPSVSCLIVRSPLECPCSRYLVIHFSHFSDASASFSSDDSHSLCSPADDSIFFFPLFHLCFTHPFCLWLHYFSIHAKPRRLLTNPYVCTFPIKCAPIFRSLALPNRSLLPLSFHFRMSPVFSFFLFLDDDFTSCCDSLPFSTHLDPSLTSTLNTPSISSHRPPTIYPQGPSFYLPTAAPARDLIFVIHFAFW